MTLLQIIGLTLLPFFELRASIPYGIFLTNIHWSVVFIVAVISNIILIPLVYLFVKHVLHLVLHIRFLDRLYQKYIIKIQHKIHPYVEKYGVLGLAIFIGIPLPGSGVYSGTLGAYLLGFNFKQLLVAGILGVLIAGTIVTLISLSGSTAFSFLIKHINGI